MKPWRSPTPEFGEDPSTWASLIVVAATVLGEAEGESKAGKTGVAYVIANRAADPRWPGTSGAVALEHNQFSCWNIGSLRIKSMMNPKRYTTEPIWDDCFWAAVVAEFKLEPDPTNGANHYLNPTVTREIRGGTMPAWYSPERIVARIGDHEFLRL